jgi:hypothetical protein
MRGKRLICLSYDFMKIINIAGQIATTASVSATAIGQIVSGLQSIGMFR